MLPTLLFPFITWPVILVPVFYVGTVSLYWQALSYETFETDLQNATVQIVSSVNNLLTSDFLSDLGINATLRSVSNLFFRCCHSFSDSNVLLPPLIAVFKNPPFLTIIPLSFPPTKVRD